MTLKIEPLSAAPGCPVERAVGRLEPVMDDTESKQLADLAMTCALACVLGQATITVSARGKRPAGFPRGELLSVGTNGAHNYACHPVKVLAWLHALMRKPPNVVVSGCGAGRCT